MLKGKKILIGVTGSIAAYKVPLLVRAIIKEGAEVKIILSEIAKDFVTPLTLSTLSGNPVYSDFFNKNDGTWFSHIELGNWADIYLIAPVTATSLGKMANGTADNLVIATYLASKCPVFFAPAMDLDMYKHPSTRNNIQTLKSFGNILIEPVEGELASGLCGAGRMEEPEEIVHIIKSFFKKKKDFNGKKILISAGPTHEPIDPVRYIGNFSSGKMGYALAEEFASRGAEVQLVSGPVNLSVDHSNINVTKISTSNEMYSSCLSYFPQSDVTIMAAAVADYTPVNPEREKIKKSNSTLKLSFEATKDILKELGSRKKGEQILIGFALETTNEIENAKAKLQNKNLDFIVLNSLNDSGAGFGYDTNKVFILDNTGLVQEFGLKSKPEVAVDIADKAFACINPDY